MKSDAIGPQASLATAAKQAAVKPQETLKACTIARREGKYVVLEVTIAAGVVTASRTVGSEYYRDLAEDVARRWLAKVGR